MKNIFIIYCNPKPNSFSQAIAETYASAAKEAGNEIKIINVYDLELGYFGINDGKADSPLSPQLKEVQNNILWADHLVFVYPVWWLSIPAKLKSLIEITFQDGVVAKYGKNGNIIPLLKGKTAVVIQTYDMPFIIMKLLGSDIPFKLMKKSVLGFTGIKLIKRFDFGMMLNSTAPKRTLWLNKIASYALKNHK